MLFTCTVYSIYYKGYTNDTKNILEKPTMNISRDMAAFAKSEAMKTQSRSAEDT